MPITVEAKLPFPLRLTGGPFSVSAQHGSADLWFETMRQTTFDERVADGGSFDFVVDRHGWASYSKARAVLDESPDVHPLAIFLECLNLVIQHLRDELELFWVYELEETDLFELSISDGVRFQDRLSFGRTHGFTGPVQDLADDAKQRLRARFASHETVAEWRILQLDARDAFHMGKYAQAAILGWTALEAACRSALPRLAVEAGLSPADLCQKLECRSPGRQPFSHEQAVESTFSTVRCIYVCGELADASHEAAALAESATLAQRLRDLVAHRGVRPARDETRRALEASDFVLRALRLPHTQRDSAFDNSNWRDHFGTVSVSFPDLLSTDTGRIVLYRVTEGSGDPVRNWFQLERIQKTWIVRIPDGITETVAATLTVLTNDSYRYQYLAYPRLVATDEAKELLVAGLLDITAGAITQAIYFAFAAFARASDRLDIEAACDHALDRIRAGFQRINRTFTKHDVRFVQLAARIASYFIHASAQAQSALGTELSVQHGEMMDLMRTWAGHMTSLRGDDAHSICAVLRLMHSSTMWLDSIVVECSTEGVVYGTSRRPLESNG